MLIEVHVSLSICGYCVTRCDIVLIIIAAHMIVGEFVLCKTEWQLNNISLCQILTLVVFGLSPSYLQSAAKFSQLANL